jgi:hypothetical protein
MPKSLEIFMTKTVTGTVTKKSAYDRDLARQRLRNTVVDDTSNLPLQDTTPNGQIQKVLPAR